MLIIQCFTIQHGLKQKKIDGNIRFNNIKYKIEKQEPSTVHDIIDLIWLPKYQMDSNIEDIIVQCVELWKDIIADEWLLNTAKQCLNLWVGRYIEDEKLLLKIAGELNMSALELRPFEEQLADVIYAKRLDQAEKKGIEKGEKSIILKLLEKNTAEEISANYNIPLEKIQKIQNE